IGQEKYTAFSCVTCHSQGQVAPITTGTFTRIINERLKDPANAGKSPQEDIAESIIRPNAYVVPGYAPNVMPQDWGVHLDLQEIKDLIAYLETQKYGIAPKFRRGLLVRPFLIPPPINIFHKISQRHIIRSGVIHPSTIIG